MSYYIAPQTEIFVNVGDMVIYQVVKRLSDFKPQDDVRYRVFKSKKEIDTLNYIPVYIGVNGKLKRMKNDFILRI